MNSRAPSLKLFFHIMLLACLSFIVFSPSLGNQFAFDDPVLIEGNPMIRSVDRSLNYFRSPTFPGDLYRPLVMLSYAVNFKFSGLDPYAFHAFNVFLHLLVVVLCYLLIRLIAAEWIALGAALLFAVHPIHIEAVANIVGRAELLSSAFILGAILAGLRYKKAGELLFALFSSCLFLFALLSKESAILTPILLLLCLYYYDREDNRGSTGVLFTPMLLTLGIYLVLRWSALGALLPEASKTAYLDNPLFNLSFIERLPSALSILGRYIGLCIVPHPLSADYSFPALLPFTNNILASYLWLGVSIIAGAAAFVGLIARSLVGFSLSWFFIAFAVTCNVFVPIGTIMGERLAYLPSLGICALAAWGIKKINNFWLRNILFAVVILLFSHQTIKHSQVWKNNALLHGYQVQTMPDSAKTQLNFAMVLMRRGYLDEAMLYSRQALKLYPDYAHAAWAIGELYLKKGITSGSEFWYLKTLEMDPQHIDAELGLGRLRFAEGKEDEARDHFNKALGINPDSFDAQLGLMVVYLYKGDLEEAKKIRDGLRKWGIVHDGLYLASAELERRLTQAKVDPSPSPSPHPEK